MAAIEDAEYKETKIGFWEDVYGFDYTPVRNPHGFRYAISNRWLTLPRCRFKKLHSKNLLWTLSSLDPSSLGHVK